MTAAAPVVNHRGGCHCGAVRYEVRAPAALQLLECNCSICSKSGYLHLIVAREDFTLLSDPAALVEYRFNTGVARHLFCRHCGVKSYYVPRSHPDGISVNARCLDPGSVVSMAVRAYDGRDWERAREALGE